MLYPIGMEFLETPLFRTILDWAPLLFRTMSLVVIAPIILLAILDITAYAIARTVGQPHSHRNKTTVSMGDTVSPPTINVTLADCDITASLLSSPPSIGSALNPLAHGSTIQVSTPLVVPSDFSHHFSSPSDGNLALSGHGIFSPPESRAGSPVLERRSLRNRSGSNATATSESGDEAGSSRSAISTDNTTPGDSYIASPKAKERGSLRQRANHLKFTPVNEDTAH